MVLKQRPNDNLCRGLRTMSVIQSILNKCYLYFYNSPYARVIFIDSIQINLIQVSIYEKNEFLPSKMCKY